MGANVWFWLIYVLVGIFGIFGINPWRPAPYTWGPFGAWLILFILVGILGFHDFRQSHSLTPERVRTFPRCRR